MIVATRMRRSAFRGALLCSLCAFALAGCAVHYHPYYRHGPPPVSAAVVYVPKAPPPPRHAAIPPRPSTMAIWIDGHWNWTGVQFVWMDGYWDPNPPRGQNWERGRWTHTSRGWYWTPGRWR
jgi:hypothetical protein